MMVGEIVLSIIIIIKILIIYNNGYNGSYNKYDNYELSTYICKI